MKIILGEYRDGQITREMEFELPKIRIGRDPTACQFVFRSEEFPMVSRSHAEIFCKGNAWFINDLRSSFGTFLNGRRIVEATSLKTGDLIQFGERGPLVRVILAEAIEKKPVASVEFLDQRHVLKSRPKESGEKITIVLPEKSGEKEQKGVPLLFVEDELKCFEINKEEFWLGRDPACDLVIEASAVMVSRRHAKITKQNGKYVLIDNNSFNGTLLNDKRISTPTELNHNDKIQLGLNGPVFRFHLPSATSAVDSKKHMVASEPHQKTIVFRGGLISQEIKPREVTAEPTLLMVLNFANKNEIRIGRGEDNDIRLDSLQISTHHARLIKDGSQVFIEDLNSTNGVFVNGKKISRKAVEPNDLVQIGVFLIRVDVSGNVKVFDTRSKARIDVIRVTKEVKNQAGGGTIRLLDNISLTIMPNEFVGLLGPSGAGKSTFMDALNGMRPASSGNVLINNLDLYQNLDVLKQSIGYVPQEDIIHRELTVYRTLYYVAKLRLPNDVSDQEIDQIINEVLDVTGLSERRHVPVSQLSGGQRKRVSIAVELITKPSVIFLDEPTSGLDPATEEKIMLLFRQIAESGRTVILTTHAMENVRLFDKIVLLMRGKLVFYGRPEEALEYVGAKSFKELYDKLEEPVERALQNQSGSKAELMERVAENWKQKFLQTPQYRKNVYEPLSRIGKLESGVVRQKRSLGVLRALRQWFYLSKRYFEVLLSDKLNLAILFLQAPIIAFLTYLVVDENQTRDFIYFVLALVSIWFGTSVAAREIIREKPIYKRERMFNLGLIPYVFSKIFVLGFIVSLQCLLLFLPLKFLDFVGLMKMPGEFFGIPQLWMMFLTALVGIALGLFVSALVKTSEMATSLVPLILIPQILFSGLVGVPSGLNKVIGLAMPASWSFDAMKSFSGLDTLKPEGAKPHGETQGKGYYKWVEEENDKLIEKARKDVEAYKNKASQAIKDYDRQLRDSLARGTSPPPPPKLDDPPKIENPKKIEENLSDYVVFLHPWMNEILSQIVLMVMFFVLVISTILVLRLQDVF